MHLEWKPNICRELVEDSRPFNLIVSTIWKPYKNMYHIHVGVCVGVCVCDKYSDAFVIVGERGQTS